MVILSLSIESKALISTVASTRTTNVKFPLSFLLSLKEFIFKTVISNIGTSKGIMPAFISSILN